LDEPARAGFAKAIEEIEDASAIEVVVALRRTSARYRHANAIIGVLVALAGLATMLFSAHEFSILAILIDPFIVGAIAAGLVELAPAIKRVLTPAAMRDREVRRAARATFVERGVHNTRDRSGVLLYISWLEQRAAVIADSGLDHILTADALAALERVLTAAIPRGGAAVAQELASAMAKLAPGMPRRPDDRNELADDVDSDLEGAR
jgi:putative membrane protein